MNKFSRFASRGIGAVILTLALILLRLELVGELGLTISQAVSTGLLRGMFFDAFIAVFALTAGALTVVVFGRGFRVGFALAAICGWVVSAGNLLHYRFFKIPLDWWIVENHWRDLGVIGGSTQDMITGYTLPGSFALCVMAIGALSGSGASPGKHPWGRRRALPVGVVSLLVLVAMWRAPFWLELPRVNRVIGNHPIRAWMYDATHNEKLFARSGMDWASEVNLYGDSKPGDLLARYRDYYRGGRELALAGEGGEPGSPLPTLLRTLKPEQEESRKLRAHLGLPLEGKLNVVYLFLESVRAFEMWHPDLGPLLFPRLRSLLDQHGSVFEQAYSSSFRAGQTVRGQFSTLCSMLPNVDGAATYIAHTTLDIKCVQSYLKNAGYQTAWFNSHLADFHRKRSFEVLHGMDQFYDGSYFKSRGVTKEIGAWGLADGPVLKEALKKLVELASTGQPLFSHVLTISTHHPFTVIPEGPVPEELRELAAKYPDYEGYLSRLKYTDDAVSDFIEGFFESPLGDNTVLVVLGDHSSGVRPAELPLTPAGKVEVRFRIPMAVVSKNHQDPQRYQHPVHQVDVTPTIATLLGLGGEEVAWVGNNLFEAPGSPWVYQVGDLLSYRTDRIGCYNVSVNGEIRCYDVSGKDPLFATSLKEIDEDAGDSRFFQETVSALVEGISLNRIMD